MLTEERKKEKDGNRILQSSCSSIPDLYLFVWEGSNKVYQGHGQVFEPVPLIPFINSCPILPVNTLKLPSLPSFRLHSLSCPGAPKDSIHSNLWTAPLFASLVPFVTPSLTPNQQKRVRATGLLSFHESFNLTSRYQNHRHISIDTFGIINWYIWYIGSTMGNWGTRSGWPLKWTQQEREENNKTNTE